MGEQSQENTPIKSDINRNPDGTFKQGNPGGPGRPKGQSLKEYFRKKFYAMSDDEKEAWLKENKITGIELWKMAEGQPKQDASISLSEDEPSAIKLDE